MFFSAATKQREQRLQLSKVMQRAINTSKHSMPPLEKDSRYESRVGRTLVVALAECKHGEPVPASVRYALTKDISSQGFCFLLTQPPADEAVIVGMRLNSLPVFVEGAVRRSVPLGGGYWELGVEAVKLLTLDDCPALGELQPLVAGLVDSTQDQDSA